MIAALFKREWRAGVKVQQYPSVVSFRQICFFGSAPCPMLSDVRDDEVLSDDGWTHLIT